MTRITLSLLCLAALAACATPREQCINSANRELSTLDRLIATTQGNINRGFALVEVQDVRVLRTTCEGTNEDGSTFRFPCEETETFTRQEPVSLNIAEERIKLDQLQSRRASVARDVQARVQQCIAVHPE
ncbi:hypothetical protein [Pseudooctadecabacter jejudonensis]|uniref:Lipoprotein n=1 Tax=Pseudooctadecabacter jejudonensis TaxID=1391910 RepID=A0A1Y5T3H4_9RHOB|nr:hypothetical protein [Pseudooctadecabacter jejudonensis]SLN54949.1 hypothetical protein PSJ8397_02882 [Pseudooctadecabacter jejudonensis]